NDVIKKAQKNSEITEDDQKKRTDEIQKKTDKMIEAVNKTLEEKEAELMMV
ncbi:MAG: ribosome recycling factor, partial [Victivallales bacterium]|nr:ribosome recycling factor [Victivallales bacterium]